MKIYLATWAEDDQGETLTKTGNRRRLMSYYFLKDVAEDFVVNYVKDGFYLKGGIKDENKKRRTNNGSKNR